MTDDNTDETDDVTHRLTMTDDDAPSIGEKFMSLFDHDEPAKAASVGKIGADSVRTDEWHIPYDEHVDVYVTHDGTKYRVVERDGELALEQTESQGLD